MAKGKYAKWITKEGLTKIEGWARDGLTDEQIARNMGVSRSTLNSWREKYPDISDTLKKGKDVVDRQVENALLKKALGYSYIETTEELRFNRKTGKSEMVVTKKTTKTVPPDTTAQIFWLKNRKPEDWSDRKDVEISGSVETSNPFAGLTEDQLRKLARGNG